MLWAKRKSYKNKIWAKRVPGRNGEGHFWAKRVLPINTNLKTFETYYYLSIFSMYLGVIYKWDRIIEKYNPILETDCIYNLVIL